MVDLHGEFVISFMRVSNPMRLAGLEGRKKKANKNKTKKTLGAGKTKPCV